MHFLPISPLRAWLTAALLLLLCSLPVRAAGIVVGFAGNITSLDPHFHNSASNANLADHMFDALVARDNGSGILPALALSWTLREGGVWEIKLRPNVTFHNGAPFTAEDVLFSIERTRTIKNSPSPFTIYTRAIKRVVAVDKLTVRIHTDGPAPTLPYDLAAVLIVSKAAAQNASTEDFNSGKALIGTGPFKFASMRRNERIDLVRNKAYWGKQGAWDTASILFVQNEAARSAALLAGKVDVIESVPTQDLRRIAANPALVVSKAPSFRLIYLHVDGARERTPFAAGLDGKPLAANPLSDPRVRRAMSLALNREAIVAKVLEGMGEPSGQLVPAGAFGHVPELAPQRQDLAEARRLLAQAGYPKGFRLTLHATNDHYVNDRQVAQTMAAMLSKVGILTQVQSMPSPVFFGRANKLDFSLLLAGWNADSGMAESAMKALLATHDPDTGMGNSNRGRYSNPLFDQALSKARATFSEPERRGLLHQATRLAMQEMGIIPLYFQTNVWASKKGWQVNLRQDGRTYIHQIRRTAP